MQKNMVYEEWLICVETENLVLCYVNRDNHGMV